MTYPKPSDHIEQAIQSCTRALVKAATAEGFHGIGSRNSKYHAIAALNAAKVDITIATDALNSQLEGMTTKVVSIDNLNEEQVKELEQPYQYDEDEAAAYQAGLIADTLKKALERGLPVACNLVVENREGLLALDKAELILDDVMEKTLVIARKLRAGEASIELSKKLDDAIEAVEKLGMEQKP